MDLFQTFQDEPQVKQHEPLAARMAPQDWPDYIGQSHLVGEGKLLRRSIDADRLGSSIFFGPSGTGKTALARLVAKKSKAAIEYCNAVTAGVQELRQVIKRSTDRKKLNGQRSILVIDEIHHFNRTQQDALLPDVERGNLTLIGLTTENPSFYVNAALMSRSTAYEFFPLTKQDLSQILENVVLDKNKISSEAKIHLISSSNGDARRLLNSLEIAVSTTPADEIVTLEIAEECTQRRAIRYDKHGDEHYDTISAFIKSMRGSDPDAAIYWMAKMLHAGEDPRFIARRVMIFASEDIGNADPQAISVATAAAHMVELVGMPEARIPLAQAVTYMSCAIKSNASYLAVDKALAEINKGNVLPVPNHLKDANLDRHSRGHGEGYKYPHDFPGHHVQQIYLDSKINFYKPSEQGYESVIKKRLDQWQKNNPDQK